MVPLVADGRQVGKGMWKAKEREPSVTKVPLSSILTILQGLLHAINQTECCVGGTLVGGNGGLKALGMCDQGTTPNQPNSISGMYYSKRGKF